MARVTIQDCLLRVSSPFDLTMIAAKRARQLTRGAEAKLPWDGHKSTVLALREIADGQIGPEVLKEVDLPVVRTETTHIEPLDPDIDWGK
jgi:DNA-directed RNA polymerase subunit omega